MDIYEIRKSNLVALIGKQKKSSCAARWEMSAAHLSQILSERTVKNIGDEIARRIEEAEKLPRGWMDTPKAAPSDEMSEVSNVEPGPPITSPIRRIDIVGTAQLGPDGYWLSLEMAEGFVETYSRDEDAYALRLKGDSMSPAIRNGWVAVCEPNHRLVPGEYVMVTTTDGQSMVKELLFENDEAVSLMSVNSAYGERRTIPRAEIYRIHYVGNILAPSKVLGRY